MKRLIALVSLLGILFSCTHSPNYRGILYKGVIDELEITNYDNRGHRFNYEGLDIKDKQSGIRVILEDNDESDVLGDNKRDRYIAIKEGVERQLDSKDATRFYHLVKDAIEGKLRTNFDTLV